MSTPTLAVTGGTGFAGRVLIRRARAEGWTVRALARSAQAEVEGVHWIAGSLETPDALKTLMLDCDAVIHLAGATNAPDRDGFEAANVAGTLAVVDAARKAGVDRFVHVSSLTAREPDLCDYGWSKAKSETIVAASGLDWTIIRPPAVYGPTDRDMLDLFRMAKWGFIILPPPGQLAMIEVSDLARLLLSVIPFGETRAKIYEADDGRAGGWTSREMAKAVGWAMGRNIVPLHMPPAVLGMGARLDRLFRRRNARLTADRVAYFCHPDWTVDAAKRPPGEIWQPAIKTREGLKATAAAYRAAGWL